MQRFNLRACLKISFKAGSQAPAWEPTCLEAPASPDAWMSPDNQEAREARASVPAFPSWSLGTSEIATQWAGVKPAPTIIYPASDVVAVRVCGLVVTLASLQSSTRHLM